MHKMTKNTNYTKTLFDKNPIPEGSLLGSGGATVPQSGNDAHTLPPKDINVKIPTGSSTVKRWSLLSRVQKLCKPTDDVERGPAVVGCGMPSYEALNVNIHLRTSERTGEIRAGVSGVYRCGSPWLCPVCSVGKAHERAERVHRAATATLDRGGAVALVVLTASHSDDMSLKEIKTIVQRSSSESRKGRAWTQASKDYGILGVVVGQEVTFSITNGWHYHQHLSVFVQGSDVNEDSADVRRRAKLAGDWIAQTYASKVRKQGGTVSDRHGWHVRVAIDPDDASNYTAKGSMAWEVSGAHKDITRLETSFTPWDIAVAASEGDKMMFSKWREYMNVMPGTRSCVISPALARKLDLDLKIESVAADGDQMTHESDEVIGRVDTSLWRKWIRHGLAATFLSRVEIGGQDGFDKAVIDTESDAEPLEKSYQYKRAKRLRDKEYLAEEAKTKQVDRETGYALDWAKTRLRLFNQPVGTLRRLYSIIDQASSLFPNARVLKTADLIRLST